jgi:hypothetical protein
LQLAVQCQRITALAIVAKENAIVFLAIANANVVAKMDLARSKEIVAKIVSAVKSAEKTNAHAKVF